LSLATYSFNQNMSKKMIFLFDMDFNCKNSCLIF